jgi:hypothetical protein
MYATQMTLVVVAVGAEPFDKEQLRKAIGMPKGVIAAGIQVRNSGEIILPDALAYLPGEIAANERVQKLKQILGPELSLAPVPGAGPLPAASPMK